MLEDIAQKLAVSTSEIIGYEVIITNEQSIIIGSSDTSRLGDFHEASIKIIETGKPNPDTVNIKSLEGTKPGFALPIEIFDKNIGSFGITGKRKEVRNYGYLLKKYIETMLYQEMYLKSHVLREQAVENLIQEISVFDLNKHDENYLVLRGRELGYDLLPPRIAIIIDLYQFKKITKQIYKKTADELSPELEIQFLKLEVIEIMQKVFKDQDDLIALIQDDKFIILSMLPSNQNESSIIKDIKIKCTEILQQFETKGLSASIGIGTTGEGIDELNQSYKAARRALKLGKSSKDSSRIYYMNDLILEDLSACAYKSTSRKCIHKLMAPLKAQSDWEDLANTICAWCESGFNQKDAANKLFIHRNTLNYRLNKIYEITKGETRDFKKMLVLYMGILMENMHNV